MNDIWHTTDITPEEDRVIVVKSKRTGEYLVGSEFEFILDNFTKWAYFDDLLALETELERTRKENEDKQAVLNCVVDMLKTLNQKYTLIMGKDVIKETVRLLEQTKGGDNE